MAVLPLPVAEATGPIAMLLAPAALAAALAELTCTNGLPAPGWIWLIRVLMLSSESSTAAKATVTLL